MPHRFHIAGLLRKKFSKKWLAPPGSTLLSKTSFQHFIIFKSLHPWRKSISQFSTSVDQGLSSWTTVVDDLLFHQTWDHFGHPLADRRNKLANEFMLKGQIHLVGLENLSLLLDQLLRVDLWDKQRIVHFHKLVDVAIWFFYLLFQWANVERRTKAHPLRMTWRAVVLADSVTFLRQDWKIFVVNSDIVRRLRRGVLGGG